MPESKLKVYVFYYKNGQELLPELIYQPVMAGKAMQQHQTSIQGDDTGENISAKNKYYSELTGIYWVWKNTKQKITGACHYRRYFTAKPEPYLYWLKRLLYYPLILHRKRFGLIYTNDVKLFIPRIIGQNEIEMLLEKYDAILPQPRKMKSTVQNHYKKYHDSRDLEIIKQIIQEKYPDYSRSLYDVLQGKQLYANNMFIMKDEPYQEFMNWWFDVLFEFESRIDLSRYTGYQQRIMGFMAERLLNVWFRKKQLNCVELPVIYFKSFKNS